MVAFRTLDELELGAVAGGQDIIVWGYPPSYWGIGGGGGGGGSDGWDSGAPDHNPHHGESPEEILERWLNCSDSFAIAADLAITSDPRSVQNEIGVITYISPVDGTVRSSGLLGGDAPTISSGLIYNWLASNGIPIANVLGFAHNHPVGQYATTEASAAENRYPSGADWERAREMVAAGADPEKLSLYIIDTQGALREFRYADREIYDPTINPNLPTSQILALLEAAQQARITGSNLPPILTQSGGC